MTYGSYKDLVKRAESEKVGRDKAFKIASNPRYDGYERRLFSMVYEFFDKKSAGIVVLNPYQVNNSRMNFIKQPSENLKDAKPIIVLKMVFGVFILVICN